MSDFRVLGLELAIIIVMFEISVLEFILLQSLVEKQKSLNLRPRMSYLSTFGLEFENDIVIFEISILEFF